MFDYYINFSDESTIDCDNVEEIKPCHQLPTNCYLNHYLHTAIHDKGKPLEDNALPSLTVNFKNGVSFNVTCQPVAKSYRSKFSLCTALHVSSLQNDAFLFRESNQFHFSPSVPFPTFVNAIGTVPLSSVKLSYLSGRSLKCTSTNLLYSRFLTMLTSSGLALVVKTQAASDSSNGSSQCPIVGVIQCVSHDSAVLTWFR